MPYGVDVLKEKGIYHKFRDLKDDETTKNVRISVESFNNSLRETLGVVLDEDVVVDSLVDLVREKLKQKENE